MALGKENGNLLKEMLLAGFTSFIIIDNNLSFQNNFSIPVSVVILLANDNTYETIMEFFDRILDTVKKL